MEEEENETTSLLRKKKKNNLTRNLIGFWLLGLTNNFGYVIMLSSAHDILTPANTTNSTIENNRTGHLIENCNPEGTGTVLLADILPALIVKLCAPIILQRIPYVFRISTVLLFSVTSFILVSFGGSENKFISIIGVVCASLGCGLGETTYLGLMSNFNKNVISTWSSGTGAAGLLGSTSYAGLTSLGLTPKVTLLIMIVVPMVMACSYFILLVSPTPGLLTSPSFPHHNSNVGDGGGGGGVDNDNVNGVDDDDDDDDDGDGGDDYDGGPEIDIIDDDVMINVKKSNKSAVEKMKALKPIIKYMIPLFFVYLIEYIINQALYELIIFKNIWLEIPQQYRWYLVLYQVGVFLSRSSVNIIHIPIIWVFPFFQFTILVLLACQVFFHYIAYIFIVFFIIVIEGIFSGGAYVNAFYAILHNPQVPQEDKELCMSVTCLSDSFGITLAGLLAIPIHNFICGL